MFKKIDKKKILIILGLAAIVFVASLPAFRSGIYTGHDLKFHLGRIQAIAEELQAGQFPVRYESSAWYGHGYVSTSFYGNIFLYIPAMLYIVGLPIWRAYNIYVILVNLATVLVAYFSFKGIFKCKKWALCATILYTLSGYRLANLYVRTALGEFTAMVFVPLVVYGIYRIYGCYINEGVQGKTFKERLKVSMPLIIGATGIIQSHILTTELVAGFVFLFAILNFKRTISVIKELLTALVAIVSINAFFLVPFIDSYRSMRLHINSKMTEASIQPDGLYLRQIFGPITIGRGSSYPWSMEDEGFLNLGLLNILCFAVIVFTLIIVLAKKRDWFPTETAELKYKWAMTIFGFGILAAWLSSVYFPWHLFAGESAIDKLMSSVQYPWRYSMFQNLFFTIAAVYGLKLLERTDPERAHGKIIEFRNIKRVGKSSVMTVVLVGLIALGTTAVFDYTLSWGNVTVNDAKAADNWADNLYLPKDTDRELLKDTQIRVDEKTGEVTLPVLAYNNVHVYDDVSELKWYPGDNNCIAMKYSGDSSKLVTRFVEPAGWRVSEIVSALAICACVIAMVKSRAKS